MTLYRASWRLPTMTRLRRSPRSSRAASRGIIEAVLVAPDFLYKPEFGVAGRGEPGASSARRGTEMATRLSYLFRASAPGRRAHASRAWPESSKRMRAFARKPSVSSTIRPRVRCELLLRQRPAHLGAERHAARRAQCTRCGRRRWASLMQQETRTFLDYEVFDPAGSGTLVRHPHGALHVRERDARRVLRHAPVTGDAFQRSSSIRRSASACSRRAASWPA